MSTTTTRTRRQRARVKLTVWCAYAGLIAALAVALGRYG